MYLTQLLFILLTRSTCVSACRQGLVNRPVHNFIRTQTHVQKVNTWMRSASRNISQIECSVCGDAEVTTRRDITRPDNAAADRRWLNKGGPEQNWVLLDRLRTKICYSVKYSLTCATLHLPQSCIFRSPTWTQLCTNYLVAHNRCCQCLLAKPTLQ